MNNLKLQNKELDQIGNNLLESIGVSDSEINKIINSPELFKNISNKIRIKGFERPAGKTLTARFKYLFGDWQLSVAAATVLVAVMLSIATLSIFRKANSEELISEIKAPEVKTTIRELEEADPEVQQAESIITSDVVRKAHKSISAGVISKNKTGTHQQALKNNYAKRRNHILQQEEKPEIKMYGQFYSLSFTGVPESTDEELQIVRVSLPRSSFISLGVNIPLEYEDTKIKTELLVGNDGIAKAIRLIK